MMRFLQRCVFLSIDWKKNFHDLDLQPNLIFRPVTFHSLDLPFLENNLCRLTWHYLSVRLKYFSDIKIALCPNLAHLLKNPTATVYSKLIKFIDNLSISKGSPKGKIKWPPWTLILALEKENKLIFHF